jgi:hypothetical protein
MTVLARGEAKLPPLRRKTIDVPELGGEVIAQALTLSESLRISMMDIEPRMRLPHILAVGILAADMKPLWSVGEWDQFGSVDENRVVCMELCGAIFDLSKSEKKSSPPT